MATKNLALEELLAPATDQNEMGNAINKEKKDPNPSRTTGSKEEKLFKWKSSIERITKDYLERPNHLLACFNKKLPPNIDKKTGDQAAKKGFIIPLTPRELKLKLKI